MERVVFDLLGATEIQAPNGIDKLEAMAAVLGDDLRKVIVSPNISVTRDGEYLKGAVVIVRASSTQVAAVLTPSIGAGISVFKLATIDKENPDDDAKRALFGSKILHGQLQKLLSAALPQTTAKPYRYSGKKTATDWEPALGRHGLLSIVTRKRKNDDDIKDVFLVVRAFPEEEAERLYRHAIRKGHTLGYVQQSEAYRRLLIASSELRRQLAALVIAEMGWDETGISTNAQGRKLATVSIECSYNTLEKLEGSGDIAYYNAVYNTEKCLGGVVYGVGPEEGFLLFEGDPATKAISVSSISRGGHWSNEYANLFPIGSGRKLTLAELKELSHDTGVSAKLAKRVVYGGHANYNTRVFSGLYYTAKEARIRELAYNKLGYSRSWPLSKLAPVISRIAPEDIGGYSLEQLLRLTSGDAISVPIDSPIITDIVRDYRAIARRIKEELSKSVTLGNLLSDQVRMDYIRIPRAYAELVISQE